MQITKDKKATLKRRVEELWQTDTLEELKAYVRLPCKARDFDRDWEKNGFLHKACSNAARWAGERLPHGTFQVLQTSGRTPALFFEIPATTGAQAPAVFFYGHLDKQPEAEGWSNGRKPFEPVVEGNCLYGRGAADDGYNFYAAITAVSALEETGVGHPRIVGLYETDEECGSRDFEHWMQQCRDKIEDAGLVVVMDCGGADYERLWASTSFRGSAGFTLGVKVAEHGVHSGLASGIAPSSFMIARALLDRIENSLTGEMPAAALNAEIPAGRLKQMRYFADTMGERIFADIPWANGTHARTSDPFEAVVMNTWKPQLCVTGASGIPPVESAGNVLRANTDLRLSVRLPPTTDADGALKWMTETLTAAPLYGCRVTVRDAHAETGWNAPLEKPWFAQAVNDASDEVFGEPAVYCGCGASIGILPLFDRFFDKPQYLLTGVLGPHSNAHGPDEMLRLDYAAKLTALVALVAASVQPAA